MITCQIVSSSAGDRFPSESKYRRWRAISVWTALEYSVMACMRASVACERKVLELSVARDAARLMRESWDRSSACLKGIAQRPPPKVTDARLEYRMCFHFPGLRATRCLLLPKMTVADLLKRR